MKILIAKISLIVIGAIASLSLSAQVVEVSVTIYGNKNIITNNGQFDATGFVNSVQGFFPLTVTIKNTGTSTLTLNKVASKYINLSGNGASDFTVNESGIAASILAGASTTFTVDIASSATNGTGKIVTLNLSNNDPVNGTYAGSIKYTFTNKGTTTSITNASDIGLSLYPNPSTDGHMQVKATNVVVNRIVVSNVAGQTEEFTTSQFTTSLKGLLLVKLYTDKGVVSEKIIIQE
jgi:hypothetical protein